MKAKLLLVLAAAAVAAPAFAQSDAQSQCIVAGRLSDGRWAPRMAGLQLLGPGGQVVSSASKESLSGVRQVRLAQPALLSRCDGANALATADNEPAGRKTPVPALSPGVLEVEQVGYPKLRTGGELVELRVRAPGERVVMLTR